MIPITDREFKQLAQLIKGNFGVNLGEEKKSLLVGRLHNVLAQKNFNSFSEYYDYVVADKTGDAIVTLVEKLTTNHTYFMREIDHFHYFRDKVLPYLEKVETSKDLRIWSAGCSSGEEPYTLAMIMADFFGSSKSLWETKILATDISTKVLESASKGVYLNEQIAPMPKNWQQSYFKKVDNEKSVIVDKLRNEVVFRTFNLMKPVFPFKKRFHVIFCRNVMIYFDAATKRELINRFYECMEPGGYLFIGHSESLNREETKYKYVMPSVYRKG
jgi:chemotaxis protein methyltransferase CheR